MLPAHLREGSGSHWLRLHHAQNLQRFQLPQQFVSLFTKRLDKNGRHAAGRLNENKDAKATTAATEAFQTYIIIAADPHRCCCALAANAFGVQSPPQNLATSPPASNRRQVAAGKLLHEGSLARAIELHFLQAAFFE